MPALKFPIKEGETLIVTYEYSDFFSCCGIGIVHDLTTYVYREDMRFSVAYFPYIKDISEEVLKQVQNVFLGEIKREAQESDHSLIMMTDISSNDRKQKLTLTYLASVWDFDTDKTFFNPNSDNKVSVYTRYFDFDYEDFD